MGAEVRQCGLDFGIDAFLLLSGILTLEIGGGETVDEIEARPEQPGYPCRYIFVNAIALEEIVLHRLDSEDVVLMLKPQYLIPLLQEYKRCQT